MDRCGERVMVERQRPREREGPRREEATPCSSSPVLVTMGRGGVLAGSKARFQVSDEGIGVGEEGAPYCLSTDPLSPESTVSSLKTRPEPPLLRSYREQGSIQRGVAHTQLCLQGKLF